MKQIRNLPSGWSRAKIGDVRSKTEQVDPKGRGKFVYIDIGSVDRGRKVIYNPQVVYGSNAPSRARKLVKSGDTLVSLTRPNLNSVCLVGEEYDGQIASTGFDVLRLDGFDARWIYYIVRTKGFVDKMSGLVQGALYPAIRSADVDSFEIPVAPVNEQRRIADKLDRVLARVDAANEHLSRVGPLLKRFRQAVLDAAVSGGLLGKDVVWTEVKLGDLLDCIEAGKNVTCIERPPEGDEKGLVKISSVTWGEFDNNESKTLLPNMFINEELRIRSGDFLISRANTIDLVGACVIVSKVSRNLFISDKVLRLKFLDDLKPWVLIVMRSSFGRDQIERLASGNQLSMRNLSQSSIRSICIPMPPDEERKLLVEKVNALLSYADNMQRQVMQICGRLDHLVPAVLSKAFGGELVSQNPNDESASVLLARLAEAKASESQKLIRRKRQASV